MSELVKNPFIDKDISPMKHKDNVIGDVIDITKETVNFVGKLFKKRGYGHKENVGRISQSLAVAAAAKAGMTKQEIADVMTQTSPTGTKFTANDRALKGKSNEEIMNNAIAAAKRYAAMTGTVLPQNAIDQILYGGSGGAVGSGPVLSHRGGSSSGIDPAFQQLIPLQNTMRQVLSLRGINPANRIDTLAQQFYNNIVVPAYGSNFNGSKRLQELDMFDVLPEHADEVTDAIITGIVAYINNLQNKRDSGADLNKTEAIIVTGTDKATEAITAQGKSVAAEKFGQRILFGGGWIWILAGVAGVIILVLALKK